MTEETEYGLVLSFVDQSPSFAHGWEAGALYAMLEASEPAAAHVGLEGKVFAAANWDMIERVLAHFDIGYTCHPCNAPEDTCHWVILRDVYHDPKPRPTPRDHLSVVK